MKILFQCILALTAGLSVLALLLYRHTPPAQAYVEVPYTLGRIINESANIVVLRVEKVDKTNNVIVYRKVEDIKGKHPMETVTHNIGRGGFHAREWQNIINWADAGKTAVFCYQGGASETCIDNYWYQAYGGGAAWSMSHAEPFFLRSFAGRPEKLAETVKAMLAGQEVVVPCMVDGDKNAIQLRTARIQRLKVSLKLMDYNAKRDFVGWGGDDFRQLGGMPGFSHYAGVSRVDPGAGGVAVADIDGDKQADFCFYGQNKVSLLQVSGSSLNEISLPYTGGARAADFADYNGDGKPDLLLATSSGPRLLTNLGKGFKDDTGGLPFEPYYNTTAAAWIDYDNDKLPDILLANGFLGLRLYRNLGPAAVAKDAKPAIGNWYYIGPFDNASGKGFETAYPPEKGIDLKAQYPGKGGNVGWKEGKFTDGQINNLIPLLPPPGHSDSVIYLYREFTFGAPAEIPISLGSDDTLTVWLNGEKLLAENSYRAAAPDQHRLTLKLKPGKNELLLKICQGSGECAFYYAMKALTAAQLPLFEDISDRIGLGPSGVAGHTKGDHLVVADVNGDGWQDFVYSAGEGVLAVRSGKGYVDYKPGGVAFKPGNVSPVFVDINGDGKPDLFVPQKNGCKLFLNNGQGRFTDVSSRSGDLAKPLGRPTSAAAADFDGDGKPDLFVGCFKGGNRFFRNQGDGTFAEASEALGLHQRVFNSRHLALADVNKDGNLDLLLANEGQESAVILGSANQKDVSRVALDVGAAPR